MKPKSWLFIILLAALTLASFWRILTFYFFQDDFQFLWYGVYHPYDMFLSFRHPGTPLEAILLAPLFGLASLPWEITGILLKIIASYVIGVFVEKLTNSKLGGFLAAVFFSVSYTGMYSINNFGSHLTVFTSIFILLSLIYLIKSLQLNTKYIWVFALFLLLGISFDPARATPVILFLPFLMLFFLKAKNFVMVRTFITRFLLGIFIIGVPLFLFWYVVVSKGAGSQFEIFIRGMIANPRYMITKTKDIGNFAATMTNVFTDSVYGLQLEAPKYEVALYSKVFGLSGVGIFIGAIVSFFYFLKKKKRMYGVISFFILWTYIFYLPNFLAEPRAPMSSINHYLFISSIGSVGLFAYLISLIKRKWLVILVSIVFIILNIHRANALLLQQYPFRSTVFIEKAWQTILVSAPKKESNDIFFFNGNTYWANYSFLSFGSYHYLLSRKNSRIEDFPLLITDERYAMSLICAQQKNSVVKQVPLSHVYSWNVQHPGILIDNTLEQREKFREVAQEWNCSISE